MPVEYLDLADFLLISEAVLGIEIEVLQNLVNLPLADSALNAPAAEFDGVEFYPAFEMKVAVLCRRLAKNHPLPDGNKRVAYLCAVEFAERNGFQWVAPIEDGDDGEETVQVIQAVAAGEMDEPRLSVWISQRLVAP